MMLQRLIFSLVLVGSFSTSGCGKQEEAAPSILATQGEEPTVITKPLSETTGQTPAVVQPTESVSAESSVLDHQEPDIDRDSVSYIPPIDIPASAENAVASDTASSSSGESLSTPSPFAGERAVLPVVSDQSSLPLVDTSGGGSTSVPSLSADPERSAQVN